MTEHLRARRFGAAVLSLAMVIGTLTGPAARASAPSGWRSSSPMSTARTLTSGVELPNGLVLVAGGQSELVPGSGAALQYSAKSAELFDPRRGVWTATGSMNMFRKKLTLVVLHDGRVLAIGGRAVLTVRGGVAACQYVCGSSNDDLTSAEIYNPGTGTWTPTGSMTYPRVWPTATVLADGTVLVTGGGTDRAERFDPGRGLWSPAGTTGASRLRGTATQTADGRVLVCGGGDQNSRPVPSCTLYDPTSGRWKSTGDLPVPVSGQTGTLLANGWVLVAGGLTARNKVTAATQLWNPSTGRWILGPPMAHARAWHGAIRLPDDDVLVCGGGDESLTALTACERFHPGSRSWVRAPSLHQARFDYVMVLLGGRDHAAVLAAGGTAGYESPAAGPFTDVKPTATVEVYDHP